MPESPELLLPESALPELIALDDAVLETLARVGHSTPPRLFSVYLTVVQRQIAAHIEGAAHAYQMPPDGPQASAGRNARAESVLNGDTELIHKVVSELSETDREVLRRFYLSEQSPEEICREMSLTETQFRLIKSRARARFAELVKKKPSVHSPASGAEVAEGQAYRPFLQMDRLVPLIARVVAIFGDETKASHWLSTPLPLLDGRSPMQVLEHPEGVEQIEAILTRIEHNVPS